MGKITRRFGRFWNTVSRGAELGYDIWRQEPMDILLQNDEYLTTLKQNVNAQNAVQQYPLGCRLQVGSRVFRYAHILAAGAAGQRARGAVCTDAGVERGAFLGAQVAGVYTVNWTSVAAIVVNAYRDGYLLTQGGFMHKIKSNTAAAGAGAVIVLTLYEPFQVIEALPAGRYGVLQENPYANVNAYGPAPGSLNGRVMGVFMTETVAGMFTWIQTWGPAGLIVTGTMGGAANSSEIAINTAFSDQCIIMTAGAQVLANPFCGGAAAPWDNENFIAVWLKIDP